MSDEIPQPDEPTDAAPAADAQVEEFRQKWLLAQADLDNYRKRAAKDLEQERLFRSLPLARDLLPALDNLRRGLDAAQAASDVARLAEGVRLVIQQIENVFASHSIKPIDAVGQPFDPNRHQAIQQAPSAEHPPGTVTAEFQKGYTLHDRVLRPSTVVVAAPSEEGLGARG